MSEYFLLTGLLLITIHYFIFGLSLLFLSIFFKKDHQKDNILPSVSFIVAAYNEDSVIEKKIQNDLYLDYPKDKIEIIIVSDGSNDKTEQIVTQYACEGIRSLHNPLRRGKTDALNRAVATSKNNILIFSDANSMFKPDAIKKLVRHFVDESIGGVSGQKTIRKNQLRKASKGDLRFWQYESALKQAESKLGSIPVADGEIFALRRELYQTLNPEIINDDMALTLSILNQNKRVIYDQEAITEEEASINLKDDFNIKRRMVYGGIQILQLYRNQLNPFKSFFALQFFFHKTLRYFMWLLLIFIFVTNALCYHQHLAYRLLFNLQLTFYSMALIGHFLNLLKVNASIFYFPFYYCNVNIAAFWGFISFLKQQPAMEIWKKAKR